MKYVSHVPVENFGFISVETESAEEAVLEYEKIKSMMKTGDGIPNDQFNKLVDEYLSTQKIQNGGDIWEHLDERQRWFFNEIKKSNKRRNK